ncbi:MAG: hypothetical protein ACLS9N_13445 [[Clostridium] leptum]
MEEKKTGYWGFCCGGETDSTASPAFSETTGTASSGSRDLGGIEDKKSGGILETPGFAQQELTREKPVLLCMVLPLNISRIPQFPKPGTG